MKRFKPTALPRWPGTDLFKRQPGLPLDPSTAIKRALSQAGLDRAPLRDAGSMGINRLFDRLGGNAGTVQPASGRAVDGEFTVGTFDTPDGARDYKLFVPDGYAGKHLPMVVMLHGCKQDPDDFAASTRMNALARVHGVIVLYPAQATRSNTSKCWNWFNPGDQHRDRGEPALLAGMTRSVAAAHDVDTHRIYVAGLSAGGAMAAILGREYPDLFAAIGVHSGLAAGAANDVASAFAAMKGGSPALSRSSIHSPRKASAIPVIVFHGDQDTTVNPDNGEQILADHASGHAVNIERGADGRAYTRRIVTQPGGRATAEHWLIHGGAHAWSGGSADGSYSDPAGPDASAEMLRFFLTQTRDTH